MAAQPTTRWQVSGYRFLARRMDHALVRGDVRMIHDPMRSQFRASVVGTVVACVVLGGCAALALFRPQDRVGDAAVVVGRDSGALYVAIDTTFHPVLNLASARLILGAPAEPAVVADEELTKRPRGPLVGIPGAPSSLVHDAEDTPWTVCDVADPDGLQSSTTAVLAGTPDHRTGSVLDDDEALLVTADGRYHLLYEGRRAEIDPNDRSLVRLLGIDISRARPASTGLLAAVPEVPRLTAPPIAGAGGPPVVPIPGTRIGSVVAVSEPDGQSFHVVLGNGVQEVSRATAHLIHFSDSQGAPEIPVVPPDVLAAAPTVHELPVDTFPESVPRIVDPGESPVACSTWQPDAGEDDRHRSSLRLSAGTALPVGKDAVPVTPAQADGAGPQVDAIHIPPGRGRYVQATSLTSDTDRLGSLFYVADTGVRYGITDAAAAAALGFTDPPVRVPWPVLQLLAPGPTLGREQALLAHDGVAADPGAVPVRAGNRPSGP
ncbi:MULTISPECIES: type VII secretion protein EccB [Rhodococcus]|uniref:type VII secretion protein EccB n=1 Tax=Rhodococcus TaxID=1827 RepID=UPI001021D01C|nr:MULTISPECIES: type VII secretion protein EccB [Rhodococcus]UTT47586.1 type VII secretion protein EccB [Rhodococcus gordoniae]